MSNQSLRVAAGPTRTGFLAMLEAHQGTLRDALARVGIDPIRWRRMAITQFNLNPRLAMCEPRSVFACMIQTAHLGLRPGPTGEVHWIPYKDQCTLVIGYQGLMTLVRRSPEVARVEAHLVHPADRFEVEYSNASRYVHRPNFDVEAPGAWKLAYAAAVFKDGGVHVEVMRRADVEAIRNRSQGYQRAMKEGKDSPWSTDPEQMSLKTVMRRLCKWVPRTFDLDQAIALDDAAAAGTQQITASEALTNDYAPPAAPAEAEVETVESRPDPLAPEAAEARAE